MRESKKQLEIILMDYFRKYYPDFPKGRVIPAESPDFWVRIKNRNTIGIELTRLNPLSANAPDEKRLQTLESRNELVSQSKEIFERTSGTSLFVKILFSESQEISEERMMSVSVRLAGLVRNISQTKKSTTFYTDHLTGKSLPEGLEEVLVVNHPNLRTGVWEPSNNLGISNNVLDDIKRTISKKDEKLRLYHKSHLNLYWLLITTDRLRGIKNFNLPNLIQNHNFESQFQKVFLFDLIKAQIFTLV